MAKAKATIQHEVHEAITDEEIASCFPVVHELRPHVPTKEELIRQVRIQQEEGKYRLIYVKDTLEGSTEEKPVSFLGYRILHCLFYGRQMYIHDLCTLSSAKKKGYAGALMDYAIEQAKKEKCDVVSLDSGHARSDAHRFYLNKGFRISCHHFSMELNKS